MTADVRVGDRVRVTYEGEVKDNSRMIYVQGQGWMPTEGASSVKVIERAKPKVGDIVSGADLDNPPYGSVVGSVGCYQDEPYWFRTVSGWVSKHGEPAPPGGLSRRKLLLLGLVED